MTELPRFQQPRRQPDYRCACGRTWLRTPTGALCGDGAMVADADGWMVCLCGESRFGWAVQRDASPDAK